MLVMKLAHAAGVVKETCPYEVRHVVVRRLRIRSSYVMSTVDSVERKSDTLTEVQQSSLRVRGRSLIRGPKP